MKINILHSDHRSILKRFDFLFGRLVFLWIGITLFLYILVHSPMRDWIASVFGMASRGCFFCTYTWTTTDLFQSLSALLLVCSAIMGAWVIAGRFDGPAFDRLLAFGISAFALITVPAAFLGAAAYFSGQSFLRPPLGALISALPALVIIADQLRRGWRPHRLHLPFDKPSPLLILISILAAVLLISTTAVSLTHPSTGYDALGYHGPLSIFLWQDGNLGTFLDRDPVTWALAQPGTSEIWLGLLEIIGGQSLANLGQLPFAFLGCVAVYTFTRRLGLQRNAALLAGCSFLLIPMVVIQSGEQLNDLVGAALLMSATALASRPVQDWNKRWLSLIGICLGLMVTTKLVLIPGALIIGLFILVGLMRYAHQKSNKKQTWIFIVIMSFCFSIVVAPWWLRNLDLYGNPVYPQALPLIGRGFFYSTFEKADLAFVPSQKAWLIYPLFEQHEEQSGLGALFALTCLPGIVMAARRGQRQPMVLFSVLVVGMLVAWWLLSEHFPRFLLGLVGLCTAFVPWALLSVTQGQRRLATALVAAAAIFSSLVTFYQALGPFARQPIQSVEFYDQVWGLDPAVLELPENEGVLWEVGYAPDLPEYTAYLPLLGHSGHRLVLPSNQDLETATISRRMQANGVKYIYVPASPQFRAEVEKLFDPQTFELVSQSKIIKGGLIGPRRPLFRNATPSEENQAISRYLFKLK